MSFVSVDNKGYIINSASIDNISLSWLPVLFDVIDCYKKYFLHNKFSVYIRGSIPIGREVNYISDLDTFSISKIKNRTILCKKDKEKILEKYSFVKNIEAFNYSYNEAKKDSLIGLYLKCFSTCVYGEDFSVKIPPYRFDPFFFNIMISNYENAINSSIDRIRKSNDVEVYFWCTWSMKKIVRLGYAKIALENKSYTRDLIISTTQLSRIFPERKFFYKLALEFSQNPINDRRIIENMLINELEHK